MPDGDAERQQRSQTSAFAQYVEQSAPIIRRRIHVEDSALRPTQPNVGLLLQAAAV